MYKILVVDDVQNVRDTLSGLLKDEDHTVETASNEAEALIAVVNTEFDLALVDVRLHGDDDTDESGLSLTMAIRKLNPKIQVIVMTGFKTTPEQVVRAVRYHGAVNFIEKTPDNYNKIPQIISDTINAPDYRGISRLRISLTPGQPITARASGEYVSSTYSWKILRLNTERYSRRAEIAWQDRKNFRFHVKGIGEELWREIFAENREIENAFNASKREGVPLSLLFETSRDFLRLPLEFLRSEEPDEYLVLQHPLARFIRNATPKRKVISPQFLALKDKLRVLIIASNTETATLARIDGVDREAEALKQKLESEDKYSFVEVKLIPTSEATFKRVKDELDACDYDIVHYAGHGEYDFESPEESRLFFWSEENRGGSVVSMNASKLKRLLEPSKVRLFYLSCCYGSRSGDESKLLDDDFLGVADAIVQAGVPTVLGYRWPVHDNGACDLALAFYRFLIDSGSPEIALWQARRELSDNRDDPTWLSPVLIHQQ